MFKCKNKACAKGFENLFTLKPKKKKKKKKQLKISCTRLEPFSKSVFNQLCINYCGPHLWNTIILTKKTDLEQSTILKSFKEKLRP